MDTRLQLTASVLLLLVLMWAGKGVRAADYPAAANIVGTKNNNFPADVSWQCGGVSGLGKGNAAEAACSTHGGFKEYGGWYNAYAICNDGSMQGCGEVYTCPAGYAVVNPAGIRLCYSDSPPSPCPSGYHASGTVSADGLPMCAADNPCPYGGTFDPLTPTGPMCVNPPDCPDGKVNDYQTGACGYRCPPGQSINPLTLPMSCQLDDCPPGEEHPKTWNGQAASGLCQPIDPNAPTPSPTPLPPDPAPTFTPAPTPTPYPVPTPTPAPTPTPNPSATPAPTLAPEPNPSPAPTSAPDPHGCGAGQYYNPALGFCVTDPNPSPSPGASPDPHGCTAGQYYNEALGLCVTDPNPSPSTGPSPSPGTDPNSPGPSGSPSPSGSPAPGCPAGQYYDTNLMQCRNDPTASPNPSPNPSGSPGPGCQDGSGTLGCYDEKSFLDELMDRVKNLFGDVPEKTPIRTENRTGNGVSPVAIGGGGGCPAPIEVALPSSLQSTGITISYDAACQYASGIRWMVIAVAWVLAGGIMVGAHRLGGGD